MKSNSKRIFIYSFVCLISFLVVLSVSACGDKKSGNLEKNKEFVSFFAMDTVITFTAYGEKCEEAQSIAEDKMHRLEKLWSVTDSGSDIYKINNAEGKSGDMVSAEISGETAELIRFALEIGKETGGALDISMYPVVSAWGFTTDAYRVPNDDELGELLKNVDYSRIVLEGNTVKIPTGMKIDLGSVGKGYAGDLLVKELKENGVSSAILDLGGNIQTLGEKPDCSPWKVGVRNPFGGDVLGTVKIGEKAVVTSGGYERYFEENGEIYWHILNPQTGRPAHSGLSSVTVIGDEGRLCDALSTAIFVMGLDKAEKLWLERGDFEFIAVTDEGSVYVTDGLEETSRDDQMSFELSADYKDKSINIIKRK